MKTKAGKTKGCGAGMYKCGGKHGKYEDGGKKNGRTKTVLKAPSGYYKTVIKSTTKNGETKTKTNNKRTLRGVLKGMPAPKVLEGITKPANLKPLPTPSFAKGGKMKTKKYAMGGMNSMLPTTTRNMNMMPTTTFAKGGKKKPTKKYAMGGFSQQCDPEDGSCKTVRKAGLLKRWVQNAQNRRLSNFSKKKFKR